MEPCPHRDRGARGSTRRRRRTHPYALLVSGARPNCRLLRCGQSRIALDATKLLRTVSAPASAGRGADGHDHPRAPREAVSGVASSSSVGHAARPRGGGGGRRLSACGRGPGLPRGHARGWGVRPAHDQHVDRARGGEQPAQGEADLARDRARRGGDAPRARHDGHCGDVGDAADHVRRGRTGEPEEGGKPLLLHRGHARQRRAGRRGGAQGARLRRRVQGAAPRRRIRAAGGGARAHETRKCSSPTAAARKVEGHALRRSASRTRCWGAGGGRRSS